MAVAQLVRAPGCGPGGRGFKSPRSPHRTPGRDRGRVARRPAPLAQRQSNGLLIRRFRVRIPGGAPESAGQCPVRSFVLWTRVLGSRELLIATRAPGLPVESVCSGVGAFAPWRRTAGCRSVSVSEASLSAKQRPNPVRSWGRIETRRVEARDPPGTQVLCDLRTTEGRRQHALTAPSRGIRATPESTASAPSGRDVLNRAGRGRRSLRIACAPTTEVSVVTPMAASLGGTRTGAQAIPRGLRERHTSPIQNRLSSTYTMAS